MLSKDDRPYTYLIVSLKTECRDLILQYNQFRFTSRSQTLMNKFTLVNMTVMQQSFIIGLKVYQTLPDIATVWIKL